MKIDDEMRAAIEIHMDGWDAGYEAGKRAGYRMALERAARILRNTTAAGVPPDAQVFVRNTLDDVADALQALGDGA